MGNVPDGLPLGSPRRAGWRWRAVGLAVAVFVAGSGGAAMQSAAAETTTVFVPSALAGAAAASPDTAFDVIVQGADGADSSGVAAAIKNVQSTYQGQAKGVTRTFTVIRGDAAQLTGRQISALANTGGIAAITPDAPVASTGYTNKQKWPDGAQVSAAWLKVMKGFLQPPAIAVVDSGVDAGHPDLKGRVIRQETFTSLTPNSSGDGRGHGTFVAGIAAGSDTGYAGAVPNANIVSLDVLNDLGAGMTSDVIAAADWIYRNKANYNIRVANFSLNTTTATSFLHDPLDAAVEKLWFAGVVVVAAAGNYAQNGQPSGVLYAPANDPFVVTVGASDTAGDANPANDTAAPWSAYGYTLDGFFKPEIGAPGRYLNGPVPTRSTMVSEHPERIVAPGYMWMSGTSFAAPVVSGAAAYVLAIHPTWTPDQVKGALMLRTAVPAGYVPPGALGVGVLQADYSAFLADGTANPNLALDGFVKLDPATGSYVFDGASWSTAAAANMSWNSMSWASASWSSASWSSASWSSASWNSASWSSQSWTSQSWSDASWSSGSWESQSWSA
jgi:serine protease AprX